ncbi:HK97 gp10 family phage protein [Paraburkholderia bannensis]|uniref:HK97 gp10 family phage protein n=1 Tax=Paraburkholderia bannensis TaxID=765414 RepID=A0A7W9TYV4_9BURK|nr:MULTISPECIES: HK97-gp10 family putative phage morphogenesis protein [Paraburkholderia]MBB3258223.1 HK97 gp10 family phage protein [Paraburkholderia sp. WP4_3_2]MBB6103236.1 HK97 gp10 family phage protein [Paraburkholderia bannensis]
MKTFKSLTDFSLFAAAALPVITLAEMKRGLEHCATVVEHTAKQEIGTYQDAVGPFSAWPQLADSTQEERERLGFTPNDPLLRKGDLRDSIEHETEQLRAVIGSKSDIAAYQEFGTNRIPPRPFMGPAVIHNEKLIVKILGGAVARGISGGHIAAPALGYDRDITP